MPEMIFSLKPCFGLLQCRSAQPRDVLVEANGTVMPYNFAFYLQTDAKVRKARVKGA